MDPNKSVIERAFILAKSGDYGSIEKLKSQLSKEGYYTSQIQGPVLLRQLREAMIAAFYRGNES